MIIATEFSPSASVDLREYVGAALERLDCLEEFIDFWFTEEGWSLTFMPLAEPEGAARDLMLIRLKFFGAEIAKITVDSTEIQRLYPNARVITSFVRGVRSDAHFDVDHEGLEEWFTEHNFQMNECLCEQVGPRESLVPFVLLYVLCDSTVVHINAGYDSYISELYGECEEDLVAAGLDLSRIVSVTGCYRETRIEMDRVPLLMRSVFCEVGNASTQNPEYSSSKGIRRGCSGVRFL
jgi:hypothetical protein